MQGRHIYHSRKTAEFRSYLTQRQHFLPGVTAEMLDWFWANMEKGYYLWAPGSHKRFNWLRTPYEYGFEDSVHIIAETTDPALPVFGVGRWDNSLLWAAVLLLALYY